MNPTPALLPFLEGIPEACPDDGDEECHDLADHHFAADAAFDAETVVDPADFGIVVANDLRDHKRPAGDRARIIKVRSYTDVVGICDHQMACVIDADHPGLLHIPAHVAIHRDGSVSLLHWLSAYVQHGHALNGGTIGNEVACRAAGTEGDPRTFWRSPQERQRGQGYDELVAEATDAQLVALAKVHRWEVAVIAACGGRIRGIWAHRQGHASRTSDPGSRLWAVAMDSTRELNLRDVQDLKLGTGRPIPHAWRTR